MRAPVWHQIVGFVNQRASSPPFVNRYICGRRRPRSGLWTSAQAEPGQRRWNAL